MLEEIIALGAEKIVLFGCCGVLDDLKTKDKIIIPISAVRDEGTSYHYIAASDELSSVGNSVNVLENVLNETVMRMLKVKLGLQAQYTEKRNL